MGGLRVLVVEDHAGAAESMVMLLRLYGHDVQLAGDGPTALQAAQTWQPDVLLLDLGLPGMNGYEVAEQIRGWKSDRRPLLIAVTAYGQDADRLRSYQAGIDLHLTKPVSTEELQRYLERFQASR